MEAERIQRIKRVGHWFEGLQFDWPGRGRVKEEQKRQALEPRFEALMLELLCTSGGKSEELEKGVLKLGYRFEKLFLEFDFRLCSGRASLVSRNFSNEEAGNTQEVGAEGMQDCGCFICFGVVPLTAFLVFCRFGNYRGNHA